MIEKNGWVVVYKGAVDRTGNLFFPERLSHEKLEELRRTLGSYIYANQYQNKILPDEKAPFKKGWIKYFDVLPKNGQSFVFIDPALSEQHEADYTALVSVYATTDKQLYVTHAKRYRINPTKIVDLIFNAHESIRPRHIGVEDVAFQRALLYMLDTEMKRRGVVLPVSGIKPSNQKTKEMRIMALVPYFEWGRIYLRRGLLDLEDELAQFPRARHDDLLDALASAVESVAYPTERPKTVEELHPHDPNYEKEYLRKLIADRSRDRDFSDY